jgi:peptide/nickel transport system substrate-binding protein
LADRDIRLALNAAIDKKTLVDNVIAGYGKTISSPIPEGLLDDGNAGETAIPPGSQDEATANALKILQRAGWAKNAQTGIMEKGAAKNKKILAFSLSTSNTPELKKAAETVVDDWKKIGANVDLKIFESGDINQNVIRPRKYDALLFGEIIGRDLDLYAFWHSSQRNDPGLNIALYTNSKADKILETGRMAANKAERLDDYRKFEAEIQKDIPAVFLYSPDFLYVLPSAIKGLTLHRITVPSERFLDINKWYTETEAVWNIFKPKQSAAPTK